MSLLRVKRLPHGVGLPLPARATPRSSGMDLRAALENPLVLEPGERAMVPTGFVWEIPEGFEGQVRPRSGLALRHGLTCLNTPGTVDADYRGEVCVILVNLGQEAFTAERGMRIAQMVIQPVPVFDAEEAETLSATDRSSGGFGHSGVR